MSERDNERLYWQVYHLPAQIARARAKLSRLEARARRFRMLDLLENPTLASDAFELEAVRALAKNQEGRK